LFANEYMKDDIFELPTKIWIYDLLETIYFEFILSKRLNSLKKLVFHKVGSDVVKRAIGVETEWISSLWQLIAITITPSPQEIFLK